MPANGYLAHTSPRRNPNCNYAEGTTAFFGCEEGFYLFGTNYAKCLENGTWSRNATCIGKNNSLLQLFIKLYHLTQNSVYVYVR